VFIVLKKSLTCWLFMTEYDTDVETDGATMYWNKCQTIIYSYWCRSAMKNIHTLVVLLLLV